MPSTSVSVDLYAGEVVGLVGGNGAGKSTLIRVLSGAHPADEGEICVDGEPVSIRTRATPRRYEIETIYQTLALADNVDAAGQPVPRSRAHDPPRLARRLRAWRTATREVMGRLNPNFKNFKPSR